MRLSQEQVAAIVQTFRQVFVHGSLMLFGSRVDDAKKGGDIDIYVEPAQSYEDVFARKVTFLVELKKRIGDQKVDVVLAPYANAELRKEIEQTGVQLWQS